jgi:hypothetical protein
MNNARRGAPQRMGDAQMSASAARERKQYGVSIDSETLKAWELAGTAYSVQLVGEIDMRWLSAYRSIRSDSAGFSRFHLDSTSKMVVFSCRSGDTPSDVAAVLGTLDSLVRLSNLYASGSNGAIDLR